MYTIATISGHEALVATVGLTVLWLVCSILWTLIRPRNGPFAWPVVGAFPQVMWNYHRYHDWICEHYKKYGGTIVVPLPLDSLTYVADPLCVEYMLKTNFNNYPKGDRDRENLMELLGSGIFNADGDDWTLQRKTAVHEFSVKKLREHATAVFQEQVGALVRRVDQAAAQGTALDLQDVLMRLTLESICHIGFGVRLGALTSADGSPEASEFANAFDLANQVAAERFLSPVIWKVKRMLRIGGEGKMIKAVEGINRFADGVIRRRREALAKFESARGDEKCAGESLGEGNGARDRNRNGSSYQTASPEETDDSSNSEEESRESVRPLKEEQMPSKERWTFVRKCDQIPNPTPPQSLNSKPQAANPEPQDLLSRFMTMRDGRGALYSDAYLRDVVLNFIIAGRDTSAGAITWMFYELSRNCHVEERIHGELMAVLGAGPGEGARFVERLSFEKLRKLTYLQAVLSETLRLHPSVPQDRKTAVHADVLPDGTRIAQGSLVVWTAYTMGRQESIWGADALQFRPERWLSPDGGYRAESSYKFTAFQGGPRMCLGKDLAFLEMKAAAAALIYNYRFQVVPGHPVKYAIALTLPMKRGLVVNVTRRWDQKRVQLVPDGTKP